MREFQEQNASRSVKLLLSLGSGTLFVAGLVLAVVLQQVTLGVLLFAMGTILFALRGYLNTGDKAVAAVLIFVALTAIGIQFIVHFLGP
ncbi:hypothetical protein BH23ACT11_BH23ACT11_12860 [soil metagenome]